MAQRFDAREMDTDAGELVNYDAQVRYVNSLVEGGCITVADVRYAMQDPDRSFASLGNGGRSNILHALRRFANNNPLEDKDQLVPLTLLLHQQDYHAIEKAAKPDTVSIFCTDAIRKAAKILGRTTDRRKA